MKRFYYLCMSLALFCCMAVVNGCYPGSELMPKDLKGIIGDWMMDYEEDGFIDELPYDRVVEHYAFFENNTGFYECFYLLGDKLVGSYLNREEGSFKYGLIAPGHVGVYHSKDQVGYVRFMDGKLSDPDRWVCSRPSEEMVAQMNTWANLLNPEWLAEKLIGKWMVADIEGKPALTNRKTVLTFVSATKAYMSRSFDKPDNGEGMDSDKKPEFEPGQGPDPAAGPGKPGWDDYEEFDVTINGIQVTLDKVEQSGRQLSNTYLISEISDSEFICDFTLPAPPDGPEGEDGNKEVKIERQRFEKIEADYEQAAIGLWEGKVTSEEDEYTDGKLHRWELKEDGTYLYFRQDETGAWVDDVNEFADYFIDGTLLCMRWKNLGEAEMDEHREWWEIESINDGVMKWKALRQREDGSTYTATFSMNFVSQSDEAAQFVQNVQTDGRYSPAVLAVGEDSYDYLRLDVASYDEACAEFLKLLPEGVAETAFDAPVVGGMFTEATGYLLNAPQLGVVDSIVFTKVLPAMNSLVGFAWVPLTEDLREALETDFIIYMPATSNDDMDNFVQSLLAVMPYSKVDPGDPTHLICTVATKEQYIELAPAFLTTKMMSTWKPLENGDSEFTLTDKDGNSYGKLIVVAKENVQDDALNLFLFDEALQASMTEKIGGALAKLSFYLAAPDAE